MYRLFGLLMLVVGLLMFGGGTYIAFAARDAAPLIPAVGGALVLGKLADMWASGEFA